MNRLANGLDSFREMIRAGKVPLGAVVTFHDAAVTELTAASGFDFVWLDGEHGLLDRADAERHLMAASAAGIVSLYRVPCCNHTEIKCIIDLAPAGIIVPMVMNAEDAAVAVSACRYPIHGGTRGVGPRRGHAYGADDFAAYLERSAREPLVLLQLEHIEAVRNLDAILAVPGVDGIVVGPYDLSMSMMMPGEFHNPAFAKVVDESCAKIRAKGLLLGCYTECDFDLWRARGVQFLAIKNDTNAMMLGYQEMIRRAREGLSPASV